MYWTNMKRGKKTTHIPHFFDRTVPNGIKQDRKIYFGSRATLHAFPFAQSQQF